jgi:circadian clock protein KaiC
VNWLATGVPGLDVVLNGGLEFGGVVILAGPPGAGKTIMAQQMSFANATKEHKSVYYTTIAEPHTKLIRHLQPFAFYDPAALDTRVEFIHLGGFLQPGSTDRLQPMVAEIVRKVLDEEPALVVIDSSKMLRDFADEHELRTALFDLTGRLAQTGTVLLLLGEYTPEELSSQVEFSLADGIIQLGHEAREPVDRRWLRVVKTRGASSLPGRHTFKIGPDGCEVFPRIETLPAEPLMPVSGRNRTGVPGLDNLMDGGPKRGDATLIMGPPGVGKTLLSLRWISQGLEEGERCLYVSFQDSPDQLIAAGTTFGWDLGTSLKSGHLAILHVPMGNLDLDMLAGSVRTELARHQISRTVIDSLAELVAANREEERFPAYKRSLIGAIKAAGSSLLVTDESFLHGGFASSGVKVLMFLFDNVINLRYIEEEGTDLGRALDIVKMRNSNHARTLNNVTIGDHGIEVGDVIVGAGGRLGWTVLRSGTPHPIPEAQPS